MPRLYACLAHFLASHVSDAKVVCLPCPLSGLPPCDLTWFHCKWKFINLTPSKRSCIRTSVTIWLGHQIWLQSKHIQSLLHCLHDLQSGKWIKETVDSNYISSSLGHPDCTFSY